MLTPITEATTDEERWALYYASLKSRKMLFSFTEYKVHLCILDYESPYKIETDTMAVYCLKNAHSTVLNVGASMKVRSRTIQKYLGKTSGSIADMYFKDFYCGGVMVCYVSSYVDVLLLELEYINIYKPILNHYKAFYDTGIYKFLIKEYKKIHAMRWSRRKLIHDENFKPMVEWIENLGKNKINN